MKKIIFPLLAAATLMSFVGVDSKIAQKVQVANKLNSNSCNHYVITGEGHGSVSVVVSTGAVINKSGPFYEVIPVSAGSQPITATITTTSYDPNNLYTIKVNGAKVTCSDGTTSVQFYETCYFTGGSCGDQP